MPHSKNTARVREGTPMPPASASSGTHSTIPAAPEGTAHEKPAKSTTGPVLVTGSAGLLGRELLRQLESGRNPSRGLDRRSPGGFVPDGRDAVVGDLLNPEVCRAACGGVQTVIHTAALQYHSGVPRIGADRFFGRNVEMTRNLIDAAIAGGGRHIVFVSSDMVYGMPPSRPIRETDSPRPIGPYGRSKLACERVCTAARERGLTITILRPRLMVGPGRLGVLTKLFDRIRAGKTIPMLGDGRNRYQMVSVSDVAAACVLAIDNPLDNVFNLGSHDPPPVRELLADLARRVGSRSRIWSMPIGLAVPALGLLNLFRAAPLAPEQYRIAGVDYVLDSSRAAEMLGWCPRFSDADMLFRAYETYISSPSGC